MIYHPFFKQFYHGPKGIPRYKEIEALEKPVYAELTY